MKRIILSTALLLAGSSVASAQDGLYTDVESIAIAEQTAECDVCADPWARFHGFLFRRYAGSVEMESKTPYPKSYFGRFTYLPWKPDWVNTPANRVRQSQYRHHLRGQADLPHATPEYGPVYESLPPEVILPPKRTRIQENTAPRFEPLNEVEVIPAQ